MSTPDTLPAVVPGPFTARIEVATQAGGTLGCDAGSVDYLTLTGLSLTWGRSGVQDQPATGTCTFQLASADDDRWQQDLIPGVPVTVFAAVQLGMAGQVANYVVDGGFETTPLDQRASTPNAAFPGTGGGRIDFGAGHTGARSLQFTPTQSRGLLYIPPAPFSADPNAWAAIPQPMPGDAWTIRAWLLPPLAWTTHMMLAQFATPASRIPGSSQGNVIPDQGSTDWQQVEMTMTAWNSFGNGWPGFTFLLDGAVPWLQWPGAWTDQTMAWGRLGQLLIDDVEINGPEQAIVEEQVFSGRVTDVTASWEGAPADRPVRVNLTAVDWSADLENQQIGLAGYPQEAIAQRLPRMVAELVSAVPFTLDPWEGGTRTLTFREAESPAGAMSLFTEAATSTDLVLWPTWQPLTGFYLWFENPTNRAALRLLTFQPGGPGGGSTAPIGKEANSRLAGVRVWQQAAPPADDTVDAAYLYWPVSDVSSQLDFNSSTWTGGNRWRFLWANRRNWNGHNTRPNPLPNLPRPSVNGAECRAVYTTIARANAATQTQTRWMLGMANYADPWLAAGGSTADLLTDAQFRANPAAYCTTTWQDRTDTFAVMTDLVLLPTASLVTDARPDLIPGLVLDWEVDDTRTPAQTLAFITTMAADLHAAGKQLFVYTNPLNGAVAPSNGIAASNLSQILTTVDFLTVFITTANAALNYTAQMALFTQPGDWTKIVLLFQIGSGNTLSPIGNAFFANGLLRGAGTNHPTGVIFWRDGAAAGGPDANLRISTVLFGAAGGTITITDIGRPSNGILLTACDIDRGPVQFTSDVSDVVTRVEVGWNLPVTVDGQPGYEDRTAVVIDQAAETNWGQRGAQISTQLISAANAELVATRVLNRSRAQGWRADGLAWDSRLARSVEDRRAALTLLNGATRPGLPIVFADLPGWAPASATGVYLEGGTYSYENGWWQMTFTVSPSGVAGYGARWNQLPTAWLWVQFDPAILWWQLSTATVQTAVDTYTQQMAAHAATYLVKEE